MSKRFLKSLSAFVVIAIFFSVFSINIAPTIIGSAVQENVAANAGGGVVEDAEVPAADETKPVAEEEKEDTVVKAAPMAVQPKGTTQQYPLIVLPGISQTISYLVDENGEKILNADGQELKGGLLIIDTAGLVGKIFKTVFFPLVKTLISQQDAGLSEAVYELGLDLFSTQASKPDGTTVNRFAIDEYNYPLSEFSEEDKDYFYRQLPMQDYCDVVGEENVYIFSFPLLGNPIENGEKLHEFIQMVKEQRNTDKVNLAAVSMGGTVLASYLNYEQADYNDINCIINVVALLNGTDIIADFLTRGYEGFNLEDQFFFSEFLPRIFEEMDGSPALGYAVNILLRILPRKVLESVITAAADAAFGQLIVNSPQFWAMIPNDRYDVLAEKYLMDEEHAILKEKTDAFHEAQAALPQNLLTARDEYGVRVGYIAGYNLTYLDGDYNFFGAVKSTFKNSSDAIIDIDSSTLGATFAPAGKELPQDYLDSLSDTSFVSPDKNIDLSTALMPETTWAIKNQHHEVGRNATVIRLAVNFVIGNLQDVYSDPVNFPQFNITRFTNTLTRNYIPKAKEIIDNPVDVSPEVLAQLVDAVDYANAVLDQTNGYVSNGVKEAEKKLFDALVAAGVFEPAKEDNSKTNSILTSILKLANDAIMKFYGARGFSDHD